jgi:hypothetical protein
VSLKLIELNPDVGLQFHVNNIALPPPASVRIKVANILDTVKVIYNSFAKKKPGGQLEILARRAHGDGDAFVFAFAF